jgi:hypothetical protein
MSLYAQRDILGEMAVRLKHVKINNNNKPYFKGEITLHLAQAVNTEQLQHYIP